MVKYLLISCIIFVISNGYSMTKINSPKFDKLPKLPKFSATKSDQKVANNFLRLYKLSKKGILNKKLIKNLKKSLTNNKTFKDYKVWADGVYDLVGIKSFKQLKDTCTRYSEKTYGSSLKQSLNDQIKSICFNRYVKELEEKDRLGLDFHRRQNLYIRNKVTSIVENETAIINLLATLKKNPKLHGLYSKTFANHFIIHKKIPSSRLIQEFQITPRLTRYLQTRELSNAKVSYQFFKTLLKYKNSLEDSLDSKKPKKEIKRKLARLLEFFDGTYEFLPRKRSNLNMISIAKDFTRAEEFETSRIILKKILSQPEHEYTVQANFELMWTYVLQKDYKKAYREVASHLLKNPEKMLENSQLSFWTARVLLETGRGDQSRLLLGKIIKKNPISYYAILAAKKLSLGSPLVANHVYLKSFSEPGRSLASKFNVDPTWLKRIHIWGSLNSYDFIRQEIQEKSLTINFEEYILAAAKVLSDSGDYLDSFKVVINGLNEKRLPFSTKVLEILYPTPYFHQIKRETNQDFDPIIALSLIRQESGFDRRARSRVGARGLMQLMPATAKRFKRRLKTRHLYNPSTNISIGTKYFNKLLDRYDNNLVYSLAAYNAGEHRVDRWQNDFLENDSILQDIENIPFRETRKYVKLIFRNIFFYKMLLDRKGTDKHKFNQIFDLHLGFNK